MKIEIEGRVVEVDDSFKNLTPEQQAAQVDEIAQSLKIQSGKPVSANSMIGQVNAGIADTVGGLVDFINPLDNLGITGSAKTGLRNAMQAIPGGGAAVATDAPETLGQSFARGTGEALGAFGPTVGGLRALASKGGAVGNAAKEALETLLSKSGLAIEGLAGGVSQAASDTAERQGYGEIAQGVAGVAAPALAVPGAIAGARQVAGLGVRAAEKLPLAGYAVRGARDLQRAIVPMTEGGARQVARERLEDLAGGQQRAAELGARINPNDEFGRTGAQQTGDPNLLGLERSAMAESPIVRENIEGRTGAAQATITEAARNMGGDVGDARSFFRDRLSAFKGVMQERADRVVSQAEAGIEGVRPNRTEAANSATMVSRLKAELNDALEEEGAKWAAVPRSETVPVEASRAAAQRIIAETPRAQQGDIPNVVRQLLGEEGGFGDAETVAELHGLYSELRRISRSAMAGTNQNKNLARISNTIADAILEDLGTLNPESPVGRAVNEARAFSRALHETFDQGAVGRILRRTIDGDEQMSPEVALDRTIGPGGNVALASDQSIRGAANMAGEDISDYLRSRFAESVMDGSGNFTPKSARTWIRNNSEILSRYPGLRSDLTRALRSREAADAFAIRAAERSKLADQGPVSEFLRGQPEKAITAILGADNPVTAARSIKATAAKDASGQAMAGVKGAFSDYLTRDTSKLPALLTDPRTSAAMSQVFDSAEMRRWRQISDAMKSLNGKSRDVGEVLNTPANKVVELIVRVYAAQRGGSLGGGSMGGSLQTANIFSERAQAMLRNLTNDKARRLLMDAVEDPALMRELLMEPESWINGIGKTSKSRLAPYLAGAAAAQTTENE